jgi:hypothetical protein
MTDIHADFHVDRPTLDPSIALLHTPSRWAAQRLRNVLRTNAVTSLATGLALAVVPGPLDRLLGTGQTGAVRLVGVALVVFALDVLVVAGASAPRLVRWSPAVTVADVSWVVGSAAAIALGWFEPAGAVLVAAAAAMVASFAVAQWRHLAGIHPAAAATIDEQPPIELAAVTATVEGGARAVWAVVVDHERYGRLAPNLSAVEATAADGPGLTRTCTNRRGRRWHEACTLWDEGRRFEVAVDTSDYPYPLARMRGAWWVEPADADERSMVGMQFAFQPHATLGGRLFAVAMQAVFPLVLRWILRGWRRAASEAVADPDIRG